MRKRLVVAGIVATFIATAVVLYLWGWDAFLQDWWDRFERPAERWVAIGTILLALATTLLAWQTRAEARASREELEISRKALQATTRPMLVDAPLGVFVRESETFGLPFVFAPAHEMPPQPPRRLVDRARIEVTARSGGGPNGLEGHVSVTVPLHNVGTGLALITAAWLKGFDLGYPVSWRREVLQTAVPPSQLTRLTFTADLDPGDAAALAAQLQTDKIFEFVVEVAYTDVEGEQTTRTGLAVHGRSTSWWVTHVALYRGCDLDPYIELRRRAEADSVS